MRTAAIIHRHVLVSSLRPSAFIRTQALSSRVLKLTSSSSSSSFSLLSSSPKWPLTSTRPYSTQPNKKDEEQEKKAKVKSGQRQDEEQQDEGRFLQQLEDDVALNTSYTYWQRIKLVYNFVLECETEDVIHERVQAYEDAGVILPCSHLLHSLFWKFPDRYVYTICGEAFNTYTLCHNPLLHKYDFDPFEFMRGAKNAYFAVTRAIFSKDFYEYTMGTVDSCEELHLLQAVHTPAAFAGIQRAYKNLVSKSGGQQEAELRRFVDDLLDARLFDLDVTVVTSMDDSMINGEVYPVGSVVVTAHVRYTLAAPDHGMFNPEIAWAFQSCISQHQETSWKVIGKQKYVDKRAYYRARSERDRQNAIKNGTRW